MGFELPAELQGLPIDTRVTPPDVIPEGTQTRYYLPLEIGHIVILAPTTLQARLCATESFGEEAATRVVDIQPESEQLGVMDSNA